MDCREGGVENSVFFRTSSKDSPLLVTLITSKCKITSYKLCLFQLSEGFLCWYAWGWDLQSDGWREDQLLAVDGGVQCGPPLHSRPPSPIPAHPPEGEEHGLDALRNGTSGSAHYARPPAARSLLPFPPLGEYGTGHGRLWTSSQIPVILMPSFNPVLISLIEESGSSIKAT